MKIKALVLAVLAMLVFLGYYHERLLDMVGQPQLLLDTVLTATKIAEFSLMAIGLNVLVLLAAATIEILGVGWPNSSLYRLLFNRTGTTAADLWCWVLSVLNLYDLFVLIFSFGLFYILTSFMLHSLGEFQLITRVESPVLQLFIIFVLSDVKHYVWHRFMHKMPFWELHKYHHSATEMNLITTSRGHFVEKGFLTIFDAVMFIALGVPAQYFVLLIFTREFYSFLLHSNLSWSLGWVGKYILISPLDHRLHHGIADEYFDKNYGTFFIWWDKIFGSYFKATEKVEIGVKNSSYNDIGFWRSMVLGTQEFLAAIIKADLR
ncbi:MAG: sterol desaturase/sphingolipid hydroxylase (fatty acid hydroxylase superfamily) [Bacteroidia bacterium]|jgi:sterol desaturase/sphingolipid hydroxylase (fatty acid hydroxylase superfamily)